MTENQNEGSPIMTIIGIALIFTLYALYRYFTPEHQKSDNLIAIIGRLNQKPKYEENGENPDYVSIKLANDPAKYEINGCGLTMVDNSALYRLVAGDSIVLVVDKSDYGNRTGFINASVTVLELKQPKYRPLLTIANLNECHRFSWKKFASLTLCLIAIGVMLMANRIWKFLNMIRR
jgi:hypothetical protein